MMKNSISPIGGKMHLDIIFREGEIYFHPLPLKSKTSNESKCNDEVLKHSDKTTPEL